MTESLTFDFRWEEEHKKRSWGASPEPEVIGFMTKAFANVSTKSNIRVLDLGTGFGAQAFALAEMGFTVDAVDASPSATIRCLGRKGIGGRQYENLNIAYGDVAELPYSDRKFHVVIDCCTLQCVNWGTARKGITEVIRVLKPNGRLFSLHSTDDFYMDAAHWTVQATRGLSDVDIPKLYEGLKVLSQDCSAYVDGNGEFVSRWAIDAVKP